MLGVFGGPCFGGYEWHGNGGVKHFVSLFLFSLVGVISGARCFLFSLISLSPLPDRYGTQGGRFWGGSVIHGQKAFCVFSTCITVLNFFPLVVSLFLSILSFLSPLFWRFVPHRMSCPARHAGLGRFTTSRQAGIMTDAHGQTAPAMGVALRAWVGRAGYLRIGVLRWMMGG